MHNILKVALIALGLACASFATASTASAADVGVSINLGDVAFGYQDGYWDSHHKWHKWRRGEVEQYKAAPDNHYNDWKHTRDKDKGWHDPDNGGHH
jgi:hypothetical protein